MELVIKTGSMPIKAIPHDTRDKFFQTQFKAWIAKKLSLTSDKSEMVSEAMSAVITTCWSLGLDEVKKMWEMYCLGQLDIEPRTNYFDTVLVGKVYSAYKKYQKSKVEPKQSEDELKHLKDVFHCCCAFDSYKQDKKIDLGYYWIYTYLVEVRKLFTPDEEDKKQVWNHYKSKIKKRNPDSRDDAEKKSKLTLVSWYFDELIKQDKHIKDYL